MKETPIEQAKRVLCEEMQRDSQAKWNETLTKIEAIILRHRATNMPPRHMAREILAMVVTP